MPHNTHDGIIGPASGLRPKSPERKASVENGVGFAKSSFFKVFRFRDREDLLERLAAWHVRINDERPSRANGPDPP